MSYTVNKLAQLSGVSVRTLHFYDEIGLLKPAFYGKHNYRFYEEEQLLMLQQILFYRELGFPLTEIQRILSSDSFNKIEALQSHKKILKNDLNQIKDLILTIERTIERLQGKITMKDEELYYGFSYEKESNYKSLFINSDFVEEWREKSKQWDEQNINNFILEAVSINEALVSAISTDLKPNSQEVQAIMRRHHQLINPNFTANRYLTLKEIYQTPSFIKFFHRQHPQFLKFIIEAMEIFAEQELYLKI